MHAMSKSYLLNVWRERELVGDGHRANTGAAASDGERVGGGHSTAVCLRPSALWRVEPARCCSVEGGLKARLLPGGVVTLSRRAAVLLAAGPSTVRVDGSAPGPATLLRAEEEEKVARATLVGRGKCEAPTGRCASACTFARVAAELGSGGASAAGLLASTSGLSALLRPLPREPCTEDEPASPPGAEAGTVAPAPADESWEVAAAEATAGPLRPLGREEGAVAAPAAAGEDVAALAQWLAVAAPTALPACMCGGVDERAEERAAVVEEGEPLSVRRRFDACCCSSATSRSRSMDRATCWSSSQQNNHMSIARSELQTRCSSAFSRALCLPDLQSLDRHKRRSRHVKGFGYVLRIGQVGLPQRTHAAGRHKQEQQRGFEIRVAYERTSSNTQTIARAKP